MNKKKAAVIFSVCLIAFLAILFTVLGKLGLLNSVTKIGYVGNSTPSKWNAHYHKLTGTMTHNMNVKSGTMAVDITTDEGTIEIEITDETGKTVYRGKNLETCSFTVGAQGKTKIVIKADNHKGGFSFKVNDK